MANEFKVRKGLIVEGSGSSTVVDVKGASGQLFSVTSNEDPTSGSVFSANDISGIPIIQAYANNVVKIGNFNAEPLIVTQSKVFATGSFTGSFNGIGIPFTYTFGGSGIPVTGANTTPLKIFSQTTCISASLSAQTAPSTTTLVVRIQRATSVTGSFSSLFSLTLTSGSKEITGAIATADILNKNDVIRANIQANDVAADWVFQLYTERRSS
jgi:hypothetical protein